MVEASAASKALPLGCLIIVFAVSLALFLMRDQRYIGTLPGLVAGHRNMFSIVVQVVSNILWIAQMWVVCSLVNFAARIRLFKRPASIDDLSFWSALSLPRFDISLAWTKLAVVSLALALGPGLGALWSGALTPLFSTTSRSDGQVLIPWFNSTIRRTMYPLENGRLYVQCDPTPPDPRGPAYPSLDTCIVMNKIGFLIMTASTATNVTSPSQHPKIDNSTWIYNGRSYGKGSSTGLFNVSYTSISTADQGFSYEEAGYLATASCHVQETTMFPFQLYYDGSLNDTGIELWSAETVMLGSGNMSIPPFYVATPAPNSWNSNQFGYFVWTALFDNGVPRLVTSANGWSVDLGNILCTLDFVPTNFVTNVSTVDQYITVTPSGTIENFDQTGNIVEAVVWDLDLMSRIGSSQIFSSLYTAINNNRDAVRLLHPEANETVISELAMQDALVAVADDLLTYQGILAVARDDGESIPADVLRHFTAIKIGENKYHIAQLVINIVLCLIYIWEAARTRCWGHLPEFDFVNSKALTLAALGVEHWADGGDETVAAAAGTDQSFGRWRSSKDEATTTKLVAFYEKDSRPRLYYANSSRATTTTNRPPYHYSSHADNDTGGGHDTSTTVENEEYVLRQMDGLNPLSPKRNHTPRRFHETKTPSSFTTTSSKPLLGEPSPSPSPYPQQSYQFLES